MQGIRKKTIKNVEKTTLQNDKIPSKSNYENISPKIHLQMSRTTISK
jgi:hypothetical protein